MAKMSIFCIRRNPNQMKLLHSSLAVLLLLCCLDMHAITFNFNGDGDMTSWSDPNNWDQNMVPSDSSIVNIPASYSVSISGVQEILLESLNIFQGSSLTINVGVKLSMTNVQISEIYYPIVVAGTLVNHGTIEVSYCDHLAINIGATGEFDNHGKVDIHYIEPHSSPANQSPVINNLNELTNHSTGTFRLFNIGRYVINNKGTLINDGFMHIDSTILPNLTNEDGIVENNGTMIFRRMDGAANREGIVNIGTNSSFENNGVVKFSEVFNGIDYGSGSFSNQLNGVITTEGIYNYGITCNHMDGSFTNHGKITTRDGNDGIYVNKGDFTNSSTGIIGSYRDSRYGIGTGGNTFVNQGEIHIEDAGDVSLIVRLSASFDNEGTITCINPANHCLETTNGSSLSNQSCGMLILDKSIVNNGSLDNQAFIKGTNQLTPGITGSGTGNNSGIIEGASNFSAGINTNTGYIIQPPTSTNEVGDVFSDLLAGPGNNITITSGALRLDEDPGSPIGASYSAGPQWTLACNAAGRLIFYLDLQLSGCPDMTFKAMMSDVVSTPATTLNTWTGNTNSSWAIANNWSNGVPSGCDSVVIDNGDMVLISSEAVANSITIDNNSALNINGDLYVAGHSPLTIQVSNGTINNQGLVDLVMNEEGDGLYLGAGASYIQGNGNTLNFLDLSTSNDSRCLFISPTADLTNSGSIEFHKRLENKILKVQNQGSVVNQASGTILLDHGDWWNQLSSGQLENTGTMILEEFIHDANTNMTNFFCGTMEIQDVTWRGSGNNFGIIRFLENNNFQQIFFPDVLNNHGILEDYREKITQYQIYTNTGVHLTEIEDHLGVGLPYPISFTDLNYSFSDSVFAGPDLCVPIGTYDESSKVLLLNSDATGGNLICMEIAISPGCKDTFCVQLDVPVRGEICASGSLEQLNTLIDLYDSLDGPNWMNKIGWVDGKDGIDCDLCTWAGITCDVTGEHIVGLTLPSNDLSGALPKAITKLDSLETIDLKNNDITGTLHPEFSQQINLEVIDFLGCDLTGKIPPEWTTLENLTKIELTNNNLSDTMPDMFANMTDLEFLSVRNSNITGNLPASLGPLNSLMTVDFLNNDFQGCFPASWLDLCNNGLTHQLGGNNLPGGGDLDAFCNNSFGKCHDPENCTGIGETMYFAIDNSILPWHFHANWESGRAPDYCDHVILEANNLVEIEAGTQAKCNTIEIEIGASLTGDGQLDVLAQQP